MPLDVNEAELKINPLSCIIKSTLIAFADVYEILCTCTSTCVHVQIDTVPHTYRNNCYSLNHYAVSHSFSLFLTVNQLFPLFNLLFLLIYLTKATNHRNICNLQFPPSSPLIYQMAVCHLNFDHSITRCTLLHRVDRILLHLLMRSFDLYCMYQHCLSVVK